MGIISKDFLKRNLFSYVKFTWLENLKILRIQLSHELGETSNAKSYLTSVEPEREIALEVTSSESYNFQLADYDAFRVLENLL